MKEFVVIFVFVGLTGKYSQESKIWAKTFKSAQNKAWQHVGNRSLEELYINGKKIV